MFSQKRMGIHKNLYICDLPTAVHGPYFYIFMGNFPNFVNNSCILRITAKVTAYHVYTEDMSYFINLTMHTPITM